MAQRASVLLVTWDGAGNLPPARSLVRALVARGCGVRALAHESVRGMLERDGAEFFPLNGVRHYDSMQPMPPQEEMPFVLQHIWFARAFGSELLEAVDRLRPDLLIVDICLTHALVAARRSNLPTAVLCHFPYQLAVGPFAPLFAAHRGDTNEYAVELGLAPFESHQALVEGSAVVLVTSYRTFDALESIAPSIAHVGPLRSDTADTETWRRRMPHRPLVLVGLSTSHQNQVPLLQRLSDALGNLEVEALATTGPAVAPDLLRASDNTTVLRFVSHDAVLPSADLLITHAGHGTVMAGVTHGTPMLCFPMGRDQPMIADRVAQLGLGSVVSAEASAAEIESAIIAILSDAAVRRRCEDFAKSLAGHPGLDHAVRLVEDLLPGRR